MKEKEKHDKLKTLTPKQVAINKIVDLQYWIRINPSNKIKYKNQIENLKQQYNIKSTDIRRQKEYDSKYDV